MDAEDRGRPDAQVRRHWVSGLVVMVLVCATVVVLFVWVFPKVVSLQQDPMLGTQILNRSGQSGAVADVTTSHYFQNNI
jgi:uncharacterized membrane protein